MNKSDSSPKNGHTITTTVECENFQQFTDYPEENSCMYRAEDGQLINSEELIYCSDAKTGFHPFNLPSL